MTSESRSLAPQLAQVPVVTVFGGGVHMAPQSDPVTLEEAGALLGGITKPWSRKIVERVIAAGLLHDYGRGATRRVDRREVDQLIAIDEEPPPHSPRCTMPTARTLVPASPNCRFLPTERPSQPPPSETVKESPSPDITRLTTSRI